MDFLTLFGQANSPMTRSLFAQGTHITNACLAMTCKALKRPIDKRLRREGFCAQAAKEGCLSLLQWARTNRFMWTDLVHDHAATYGHLKILQWAVKNGCEWDPDSPCSWTVWVGTRAVRGGQLNVLKWIHEVSVKTGLGWFTIPKSKIEKYPDMLEWARINDCCEENELVLY